MSLDREAVDQILGKDLDPTVRLVLERLVEAIMGNFDHLSGEAMGMAKTFNLFVRQNNEVLQELVDQVNADVAEHSHSADEVAEGDSTAIDHDDLTGVTAGQHHAEDHDHDGSPTQKLLAANTHESPSPDTHHAQLHTQSDHDRAETGDLVAVAAAADAGTSTEVPNADHRHAHGTGYVGAHSDAVNDGDAAGGDLGGTYPNPSVNDDSHSHGAGTAPGTAHPNAATHNALGLDHDSLVNVSADDHHAQSHNHTAGDSSGVLTADEHDSYSEYTEIATPATPAANKGRLYLKDDGGGKTQLVIMFSSGVELVLAVDP